MAKGFLNRSQLLHGAAALTIATTVTAWSGVALAQEAAPPSVAARSTGGAQADAQSSDGTADATASDIIVTGTSIRGVAPVGAPVRALGLEEIKAQGLGTSSEIIRSLPQVVNLGADEGRGGTVQNAAANVTQGTGVNLRGLGTESTLVLLGGRRVPPNGFQAQFTDVSPFIPIALERVEVVADGASAIYGADAVAGVVNFILRRPFDGLEVSGRYGLAKGFDQWQASGVAGRTWSGGGVMVAYEHYERGQLDGSERSFFTSDLRSIGGTDQRSLFANPGTIVSGGATYAVPGNQNGRGLTAANFVLGTTNRRDNDIQRDFLPRQKRDSVLGRIEQRFGAVQFGVDGYFTNRVARFQGSSVGNVGTSAALAVPRANPFFVNPANPAATSVTVNYSFENDFKTYSIGTERSWMVSPSVKADVGSWTLDAYASFGSNFSQRNTYGILRTVNLAAALADTNPATAFNAFCDGRAFVCNNPTTLAALNGTTLFHSVFKLWDYQAKASGPLFDLPGGSVKLAVGGEYTASTLFQIDTRNTTTADFVVRNQSTRHRNVKAGFAELFVPLVGAANSLPFVQRLDLTAAIRTEDYSDFGRTTNPKFGIRWDPARDLTLRASYGTSFRAPTLADGDPLSGPTISISNVVDPTTRLQVRTITQLGGRPGISAETAKTFTIGFDLHPVAVPGLNLSATYYSIDYTNRIETPSSDTILLNSATLASLLIRNPTVAQVQALYASPYFAGAQEDPTNIKLYVDLRKSNVGGVKQSGLDISGHYSLETDSAGTFGIGADVTLIDNYTRSAAPGATYIDQLGNINYPVDLRVRGTASWKSGGFSGNVFANYLAGYSNNLVSPKQPVSSFTTIDATLTYAIDGTSHAWLNGTTLSVSGQNLFDRAPPPVLNGTLGFDSQNASAIGRMVAFQLSRKF
ncbi:TonB-dependent receptor domain-containing protein [Sphingomonas sp.]|uniref:TonB-dependent receptor domain-containing protein n=1 Tax=Sphingomonas sp. TaxID=28214 RepID=UPI002DD6340B|nr:TonB-dependent receptor [Sphingomonas sp.]